MTMKRTRYLIAYDIRDDRRLRGVHSIAKKFGYALQYSVFICDLDDHEKYVMRLELGEVLNHAVDSVVFVNLGDPSSRGTECFEFMAAGAAADLPNGGPVIL
ncbi:CRISPR-associated protein Cas2 [Mycobacterium xenopi RIVM700367]|uniref:CRISPR-associated endonuclease Cas2 n=1 Tax=Mycobacterium xenopi TaxID=1789 RepID=UPI00025ACC58|nr:CRISPR-associated protein Cas2 [Mycobacterium xenopi RIVM700367]